MSKFLMNAAKSALAAAAALSVGLVNVQAEPKEESNENGKDETVYIITDADGSKQSVIVSDWLKNTDGSARITDETSLKDIENVSGDEAFTRNADGTITWNADGNDIYYQGTSDKELPVEVKISYELDGKTVSAEELAGKAGHVKVHFDYINNTEQTLTMNGKEETVKIPFAMITGVQIDQDRFSNIEVTNGKVISEGKQSFVVGMAFPGLSDSLELDSSLTSADIPNYVEIEADTTDFELGMTMTVAGNNLLDHLHLESDGKVAELEGKVNELLDASKQLEDGTQALKDGTAELRDGAGQLLDGTNTLKDGSSRLKDGASELADGTDKVKEGAGSLKDGAEKLNAGAGQLKEGTAAADTGASALAEGTAQLSDGALALNAGLAKAQAGAKQLENGSAALADGANELKGGIEQAAAGVTQIKTGVDAAVEQTSAAQTAADQQEVPDQQALAAAKDHLTETIGTLVEKKAEEAYRQGIAAGTDGVLLQQKEAQISDLQNQVSSKDARISELEAIIAAYDAGTMTASDAKTAASAAPSAEAPTPEALREAPAQPAEQPEAEAVQEPAEYKEPESAEEGAEQPQELPETAEDNEMAPETTAFRLTESDASSLIVLMEENQKTAEEQAVEEAIQAFAGAVSQMTQHKTTSAVLKSSMESLEPLKGGIERLYEGMTATEETAGKSGLVEGAQKLAAGANTLRSGIQVLEGYADESGAPTVDGNGKPLGGLAALKAGSDQLCSGTDRVAAGAGTLAEGVHSIADGAAALADGTDTLRSGSGALQDGTAKLADGAGQLKTGSAQLDDGVSALRDGVIKLDDGSAALDDGALELLEGMQKFETEGMDRLAEVFGDKLEVMLDRLTALNEAGTSYRNFSGASENGNDSVKFIFKTESVKAE